MKELPCPVPPGSAAVYCKSSTTRCPHAVRHFNAGLALRTAPREYGSVLEEFHCPLPLGTEAVHCKSPTTHCPQAVRKCIAGVSMPTTPGHGAVYCTVPLPTAPKQ